MEGIPDWSLEAQALEPGSKYRHFKGGESQLVKIARDSETTEEVVVYESIDDSDRVWVRPLKMFVEEVSRDGYEGPRFKKVD